LFTEEATITPVYNDAGDIINYVAVKRDITHELLLEEQYRQAQKMDALGRLTGGIAHDFNNSLTAINGFAELLKTRLPSGSPQARLAENIFNAGQRAADLTRQLLIFSRKDVIAPQIVNLNQTVAAAQTMLERIIGEDIQLETELVPDVWAVSANPGQVEQVIMNLVVNARQAMPDGGYLTIETANMVLDEAYAARHLDVSPGEYALLAVSDTGVGMTQAVQARIFEPFFTTKEKEMGTGLGLATVFGIVKQSGGHIWVYSEVGKGSTFKIYLPHFTGEIAGPAGHNRLEAIPRGSETILMAEDDPQVRTLVAQILGGQGYTVLEAASGEDALAVAQAHRGEIHLALADVVLPNMSGKTLVEALRGTLPALKVLYMSGYTLNGVEHQGIEASEENYLPKPFTPAILTQKVRAALNAND
ncbi:MAG: ATP-binding protein, partial [Anaerolineae bacterium]